MLRAAQNLRTKRKSSLERRKPHASRKRCGGGSSYAVLTKKKIPDLEPHEMAVLFHSMFHTASASLRMQVAEVVFRYDRMHRHSLDLFLVCVLPLAERAARRRAARFACPSDWRFEAMYDGAVSQAIEMFQRGEIRSTADHGFRGYLLADSCSWNFAVLHAEENLSKARSPIFKRFGRPAGTQPDRKAPDRT